MSKNFRVVIFANESSSAKELGFSKFQLFSMFFGLFLVFVFVVAVGVNFLSDYLYSYKLDLLRQERNAMVSELNNLNSQYNQLSERMDALFKSDDELRVLIDLEQIDPSIREMGTGGEADIQKGQSEFFFTEQEILYDNVVKLEKLRNQVVLQEKSYREKLRGLDEQKEMVRFIPAIRPVEGGRISDGFGWRKDPFTGGRDYHEAIDISIPRGTPIYATADGTVSVRETADTKSGLGNYIKIDHNSGKYGYVTVYGHMSKFAPGIRVGSQVKRGDKIGEVGKTGRATASHVHYMVFHNGRKIDPRVSNWSPDTFRN